VVQRPLPRERTVTHYLDDRVGGAAVRSVTNTFVVNGGWRERQWPTQESETAAAAGVGKRDGSGSMLTRG
jgi:hypothetical protein